MSTLEYDTFLFSSAKTTHILLYKSYYFYCSCHTTIVVGTTNRIHKFDYYLFQTGNLQEINYISTLSVLPPKLTWLEPTFTTILSARKYTMINLYNIAFIRPSHKCNVPSYTCIQDDFIPLLVYPNDEKPADINFF